MSTVLRKTVLLQDLQKQVTVLEDDLRARTDAVPEVDSALRSEYEKAFAAERTAAMYETWRDERVTQVAAAWVLGCVFVRFCEDNGLVADAWLSGPGDRLAEAEDRHADFFRRSPEKNDRDWLEASFEALAASHPTVAGLFDEAHNPLWEIRPSYEAASALLAFWRERGADGEIRHDFTDADLDTRFLGDLYQDLSEHARKTYALLQTPEFVEEFILDLTLEPAVEEFGLDPAWKHKPKGWQGEGAYAKGLRCIDPACGSGHFLLGMFERLLEKWREAEPGTDGWVLVRRALESVHGADKNPFAAGIARFRLLVAALKACGVRELGRAPELPIRVAVGDSLLHGRGAETVTESLFVEETFFYRTEDAGEYAESVDLLGKGSYHVVVGNPPYITVKDSHENKNYKTAYDACYRQYSLSVPFAQRIFELAVRAGGGQRDGGFTGQITANSFMKREFGKKLIEEFFPRVDLTHVIDTSGAYIPGHGTPTVILAGRNRNQLGADRVRAVLGVRGEPNQPEDAAQGVVWRAMVEQVGRAGSESEWVSVEDAAREQFARHPWSLAGGGAAGVMANLDSNTEERLGSRTESIGFCGVTREDDAYIVGNASWLRTRLKAGNGKPLVGGTSLRDYCNDGGTNSVFPYRDSDRAAWVHESAERLLWPSRTLLKMRRALSGTQEEQGLTWFEYSSFSRTRYWSPFLIVYGEVSTHNHFVLHRGGKMFKQTAPVIRLPAGAGEEQYLELLGLLNSSAACFWLKQVSHDKGSQGVNEGFKSQAWERFYQFAATKLKSFPLPVEFPLPLARALDAAAQQLAAHEPSDLAASGVPTRARLDEAREAHARVRSEMIALQEELDWTVYCAYSLLSDAEGARTTLPEGAEVPAVALGQRAFEIVLARKVAEGTAETTWFERHRSTPITEIPADWPEPYRQVIQARIDLIEGNKNIDLIERPECKRRWPYELWEKKEEAALRAWLLDACEREELWFEERDGFRQPRVRTVSQLADALRHDEDVQAVAALYATDHLGKRDASLATVLTDVVATEHVPYLAALRYKDSGLRKRGQWERVWEQQREEDDKGTRLDIRVPPKYVGGDFLKTSYWSNRGKLDVPKERFVSYPDAGPDSDPTVLLGWAGWDHKDQAQAIINVVNDRTNEAGWETPRIAPLLAGLCEVMPWVHQWHGEFDAEWDGTPSEEYQRFLDEQRGKHGLSVDDLKDWRPEKKAAHGRKPKAAE
ncbi:BREX-2 system adenine-specific DNA-methyltransferase PglX [Streptomyces sp. DH18]|uniref:BREX-2 system adenine-specific DNA-methyltransferase PglX n=1 Tax=Streptomyces sp. DH18 TaxID=3040126 RepID=UPI0024431903|nr:BREX-2 system adenine-specific DNA-methyltransferase PglX [Streptomyces sp. DH18]MDG9685963.1 BREX-2 system adenine-specific DNA-methyltransferase PglX [Streptomyces sp. DH18]